MEDATTLAEKMLTDAKEIAKRALVNDDCYGVLDIALILAISKLTIAISRGLKGIETSVDVIST